jgi:hypothetical protein
MGRMVERLGFKAWTCAGWTTREITEGGRLPVTKALIRRKVTTRSEISEKKRYVTEEEREKLVDEKSNRSRKIME